MKKIVSLIALVTMMICVIPSAYAASGSSNTKYLPFAEVWNFNEGLASFCDEFNKCGFINTKGEVVIEAKYDNVIYFVEGLAAVKIGGKWGFIDKTGKQVIGAKYDDVGNFNEGLAPVQLNNMYGYIDTKGNEVIKPQYEFASTFSDGLAAIEKNGKYGFIDKKGNEIIKPIYDYAFDFNEGLAAVEMDYTWGFIDKTGKQVIEIKYDDVNSFFEGLASIEKNGMVGFIDKTGKEVIEPQFDFTFAFSEGLAPVKVDGLWGYINKEGKMVIEPQYDKISEFSEGLAQVAFYDEDDNLMGGFIDKNDNVVKQFEFDFFSFPFINGLAVAYDGVQESYYILNKQDLLTQNKKALPTAANVQINGKAVAFEAYNIDGNNFFKLRDLAMALNGTQKNFAVGWNATQNAITLESNKNYKSVGGELVVSSNKSPKDAKSTNSAIYLDGEKIQLTAYNIGGNNYFKLRDIAEIFDFGVTWDSKANMIGINTKEVYKAE